MRGELINRRILVKRITDKYIYSTETLTYDCTTYHVACRDYYYQWDINRRYGLHRGGFDCTAFNTEEEARQNIRLVARRWGWNENSCFIEAVNRPEEEIKHHRNKVKG